MLIFAETGDIYTKVVSTHTKKLDLQFQNSNPLLIELRENSDYSFRVETSKEEGSKIISAGILFTDKLEGFYQEIANSGLIPLPEVPFQNCTIK